MNLSLTSFGGAGTVTGSKHLIEADGARILLDCGQFQGLKVLRERNWEPLPVAPGSIDAVVLTHAHLDHSGYLPVLVRDGFKGPVYCTAATADLTEILLKDSAEIAENDAAYANRKGFSKHQPALPLFTHRDVEQALERLRPVAWHEEHLLGSNATLKFRRAGHILGAATAELCIGGRVIVFSGDLGRFGDSVMLDPEPVERADYLLVESTYGDRVHAKGDPLESLGAMIEAATARGGTVVIPAFTVGRAQVLLHHLWKLKQAGRLGLTPIFLDSPMAIRATDLLCRHLKDHRLPADECRAASKVATYVRDVEASKALTANHVPKVIIAGSGMATGGRVLHHIKTFGPDPRNLILFVGFQAAGTRGANLLAGATELKMFGAWVPMRAQVANMPELSAHADADEIVQWLGLFKAPPRRTFIVHGEPPAADALRVKIGRELGWKASVVDSQRAYSL
ncbi:MAG: MBL fold metallo-hydrolase [Hyphomonadaceae bacterium]|nr:MBL fold metallo-hydrolase [Hyphomonadaceae bacterium]